MVPKRKEGQSDPGWNCHSDEHFIVWFNISRIQGLSVQATFLSESPQDFVKS